MLNDFTLQFFWLDVNAVGIVFEALTSFVKKTQYSFLRQRSDQLFEDK